VLAAFLLAGAGRGPGAAAVRAWLPPSQTPHAVRTR
jgi:hypothetical protein